MVSGLNQRIANDFWLLRPLQVDFGLVLRRPIETAALTGQLGSESRCPAVAITIFYYIRFFEARRMFRLILLNHYKIETLAWNGSVAKPSYVDSALLSCVKPFQNFVSCTQGRTQKAVTRQWLSATVHFQSLLSVARPHLPNFSTSRHVILGEWWWKRHYERASTWGGPFQTE
jgi:hypothetical protein